MRVVVVPGMGCKPALSCNWYSWFAEEMRKRRHVTEVILRDFPDPYRARESVWLPFLIDEIGLTGDTVVVGHSSGAACAMRLLESDDAPRLRGAVLVAASHTDLGDEGERISGYFSRPWDWERVRAGADRIHCFHGTDDPLIPVREARHVAKMLEGDNFEYQEMEGMSHFFRPWQELLDVMDKKFGPTS